MRAMTTLDGTACHEAALCLHHDTAANRERLAAAVPGDVVPGSWTDASGNDYLVCSLCGENDAGDLEDPNAWMRH